MYVHSTTVINWQGLNSEEEAEKTVKIRQEVHAIITGVSHVKLEKIVQFSKCELRGEKLQPEASTGHSSPFKPKGEETHQDSSLQPRRKCVKYVHSQSTDAEHVSTVEPSTAPTKQVVSRRIQFSYSSATPRHPGTMTASNKDTEIMHQIQSANSACTKDRNSFQKQP